MLVSIVIPVYNVAEYLPACLNCVVNQTWQDLQIILVDDGSRDDSGKICDEYAAKDKRIEVIHLQNGGPSIARNTGTEQAKGEYLLYMDADDEWSGLDFVEKLVKQAERNHPDVILFEIRDFFREEDLTQTIGVYSTERMQGTPTEIMLRLMQTQHFSMAAWQKFIRTDVLLRNRILFQPHLLGEDMDWIMRFWPYVQTIEGSTEVHYRYRIRKGSRSRNARLKTSKDFCLILETWKAHWEQSTNSNRQVYLSYLAFLYVTLVYGYFFIEKTGRKLIRPQILNLSELLQYSATKKSNRLKIIKMLFGSKIMLYLFGGIQYFRKRNKL